MNVSTATRNHVCFACRKSAKAKQFYQPTPICPKCRQPMHCIGQHWRVPKRTNNKEWVKLKAKVDKALREGRASTYYL